MQIKLILSFTFVIILLCKVQAKAVKRSKHVSYTGPEDPSSIHSSSQVFSISDETGPKDSSNIVPSKIGKPLYFGRDSIQYPEPSKSENYDSTTPDHFELSNYGNLESMFDTKPEFLDIPKFFQAQNKVYDDYVHKRVGTKPINDGDVFGEDQVFLHNKKNPAKAKNNEVGDLKLSKFQKIDQKSNGEPPCDNEDTHDYKNNTTDKLASSINVHDMIYGTHEPNSQSKIHEAISEDFHQYETKIIHKNVNSDETKSKIVSDDKDIFEENFGRSIKNNDRIEKKSSKLDPLDKELDFLEISKETLSINQLTEEKIPIKLNPQNVNSGAVDTLSKSEEDKHLLNMEIDPMPESNFRSFVFNPNAQPLEKFQECTTPKNESGHCRYIQHCMLPSILSSIQHFMNNVCTIQDRFIGVCCPEFPVHSVLVSWPGAQDDFKDDDGTVEVPEDCGVGTNRRVVGGLNADRKAWPWMVALLDHRKKFFCGGALINNRYVLTAAHCTFGPPNNQIIARLGEYDFNDPREPHDDYTVIEIKRHGQYTRFTMRNDVAVLKLERPVVFNEFVKTICLPDPEKNYLGKPATLAGWGHLNGGGSSGRKSNVLQEASFPIIGNKECGETHGIPIASSIICAAAPSKNKGACNGDSGGPLMMLDDDERWKVIGLVSWGRRGCDPKFPTAFSRVNHFLDWIKEHTN